MTVKLPGNLTESRYGVPVLETAAVTFLHGMPMINPLVSTLILTIQRNYSGNQCNVCLFFLCFRFLADIDRPQVLLSTTARAHTRDQLLPVLIQFTKPVFTFNNSGVTLTGGVWRRSVFRTSKPLCERFHVAFSSMKLFLPILSVPNMYGCSFREITKTTYALVVLATDSSTVKISVAESRTLDVAGNPNVASSVLQIKHCE